MTDNFPERMLSIVNDGMLCLMTGVAHKVGLLTPCQEWKLREVKKLQTPPGSTNVMCASDSVEWLLVG